MARRVGRTVIVAVTIGAALLVGNLLLSTFNTRQLRDESAHVAHSSELLLAVDNVLALVKDAETGQRGYVITGRPEYLTPYRNAVATVHRQMDALAALAADDPVQLRLLADVRRHVDAKLGELDLTIGLRDRKGFDLTRDVILLGAGKAEMDAVESAAAQMASHETRRLIERQAGSDRIYRWTVVSEFVAALVAILALVGYAHVLRRHFASRDRSEGVIAAQGEMLRTTLASIGDAVITTDLAGRVADLNAVAEALTGWRGGEARGQPLEAVFRIVNEATRRPAEFDRINRDGTARLSALAPDIPFLLLSSLAAREPQLSPYAASKRAAEEAVAARSGPWLTLRAPAVYGPGDRETLAYFKMAKRGIALQPGQPRGRPEARLSLIHVEDLAEALALALDRPVPPGVHEIDDGHAGGYSHADMAAAAADAFGRPVRALRVGQGLMKAVAGLNRLRTGAQILTPAKVRELFHPDWTVHDRRLAALTGFSARFGLADGFRHTILWYRAHGWL